MINVVNFVYMDIFYCGFHFIFLLQLVSSNRKHFSINKDNNIAHSKKYFISLITCYYIETLLSC